MVQEYSVTLERLKEHATLPDVRKCIYVSGSVVRGWGNPTSDIDIYVITDRPFESPNALPKAVALEYDRFLVEIVFVEGRRWDIEYWLESQVQQMLEKVSSEALERSDSAGVDLTSDELDFLERLDYGVAVEGAEWLVEHKKRLAASAHRDVMTANSLNGADVYTEDAVGQLQGGDIESAVLSARLAFGQTVDALLASCGQVAQNPKWRARRFQAANPKELSFERYWELETMQTFRSDTPEEWIREVLQVCQDLSMEIRIGE